MTVLAAARITEHRAGATTIMEFPAAVDIIYEGGLVNVNAAGYAAPASDTTAEWCVGIADETVDNSGGSAGDKTVRVRSGEQYKLVGAAAASFVQALVGEPVTVEDDQTVTIAADSTNDIAVGYVSEFVSATSVWVFIPPGGVR